MEKKRRERINNSLETLKDILIEDKTILNKTVKQLVKYEKADILELTVKYVQAIHSKWSVLSDSESDSKNVSSKSSDGNINDKNDNKINNKENLKPNKNIDKNKKFKCENQIKISENKRHWRPW